MKLKDKQVVVIGSGVGGAGVSALLAGEGAKVTVLERSPFGGGKAATLEKDGFYYDTGVHWVSRGANGPLGEISKLAGGSLDFCAPDPALQLTTGDKTIQWARDMGDPGEIDKMLEDIGVLPENMKGARAFFNKLAQIPPGKEQEKIDPLSIYDYTKEFVHDRQFSRLITGLTAMGVVLPREKASAGEFVYCFSRSFASGSMSYPLGGAGSPPLDYLRRLEIMGGEIYYNRPVEKIVVQNNKTTGVEAGGFIPADIVISNTGIKETVGLAGPEHFPEDYKQRVSELLLSLGAVTVKYALNKEVVKPHLFYYAPDFRSYPELEDKLTGIFVTVPSLVDASLAPDGCQVVLAGSVTFPGLEDKEMANEFCEQIMDRIENTMQHLFPNIENHVVWKMRTDTPYIAGISGRKTGEVIGVAQAPSQVGEKRPSHQTPVENLYLVGSDAGGRGVGMEMAADSALKLWRSLRDGK